MIVEDVFPTILELAGVRGYKTIQQVDGKTFVPALKNPSLTDTSRVLLWHYPNNWQNKEIPGTNYFSALRKGKWKLVYNQKNSIVELYDLYADLGEEKDLSAVYPEKTKELVNILGKQLRDFKAPMPSYKKTGEQLPYPGEVQNN